MAYNFLQVLNIRRLLSTAFNTSSGHSHDGVNSRYISNSFDILNYQLETLSAGVDITGRPIFACPTGYSATLVSAHIIPQGDDIGIDGSNTCKIELTDGSNVIVAKEYTTDFPDAAAVASLGTLSATHKVLVAGEKLTLKVTNGNTSNPPAMMVQVTYRLSVA